MGYQLNLKSNPIGFIAVVKGKNDNYNMVA
jgi:hypothetical protein